MSISLSPLLLLNTKSSVIPRQHATSPEMALAWLLRSWIPPAGPAGRRLLTVQQWQPVTNKIYSGDKITRNNSSLFGNPREEQS